MENKLDTITNLFEGSEIRSIWNSEKEDYYFSIVDVIGALTDNGYEKSRNYWKWLKNKLNSEGSELVSDTNQLKMKAKEYKDFKGIRKESLRDNMTDIEVILTDLGEVTVRDIAKQEHPKGLKDNLKIAKRGGNVSKIARESYELQTSCRAITCENNIGGRYSDKNKQLKEK